MNEQQKSTETAKPSYWAVLPAAVRYDPAITAGAKLLYAEISSLTGSRGFCYASNAYFAGLYGITERTLQRHLKALESGGYIRIQDGAGGSETRKIYAGVNPLAENPVKNEGVPPTKLSGGGDKNVGGSPSKMTGSTIEQKKLSDPPKAPQGAGAEIWDPEAWRRFWALYPKKVDKAKAIRAWNRLKADRKLMGIMSAALKAQMATEEWRRDNGRAIPYPSTWLNNRRWEDEAGISTAAAAEPPREEALPWI